MPALPEGRRYDVVRWRTEAAIATVNGETLAAVHARERALATADKLGLAVESSELRREMSLDDS